MTQHSLTTRLLSAVALILMALGIGAGGASMLSQECRYWRKDLEQERRKACPCNSPCPCCPACPGK